MVLNVKNVNDEEVVGLGFIFDWLLIKCCYDYVEFQFVEFKICGI